MEAELEKKRLKKIASEEKSRKRTQIVADVDPEDEDRSTGSQVRNLPALLVTKYKYSRSWGSRPRPTAAGARARYALAPGCEWLSYCQVRF